MSNDAIRIAVGLRVGTPLCQPHTCAHCGKEVDQFGRHDLSCQSSQGRRSRHQAINNIALHSLASANIPSRLEPSGLHCLDGKRPDGVSLVPWSAGKYLVLYGMPHASTHSVHPTSNNLKMCLEVQLPRLKE